MAHLPTRGVRVAGVAGVAVVALTLAGCGSSQSAANSDLRPAVAAAAKVDAVRTENVLAVADTWVAQRAQSANHGRAKSMSVRGNRTSVLLRFDVDVPAGSTMTRARLRLTRLDGSTTGVSVYATSGGWHESKVTWKSAPRGEIRLATAQKRPAPGVWDVTAGVPEAGGPVNLRVESTDPTGAAFTTREAGATGAPALEVTTTTSTTPAASATPGPSPGSARWSSPPQPLPRRQPTAQARPVPARPVPARPVPARPRRRRAHRPGQLAGR